MRRMPFLFFAALFPLFTVAQQLPVTSLENNQYQKVTSYNELSDYVNQLDKLSGLLSVKIIGQSVQGRNLYALQFSAGKFGMDKSKIKVLFFAQQHGNEQSGKEGALLLLRSLLVPENRYLLNKIDVAIVPQVNPDGSELNQRRNGNNIDLNRNHVILSEPETQALHQYFDEYRFDVTLDVHEYYPYGEEWQQYGYRRDADITLGSLTNPNINSSLRDFENTKVVPCVFEQLKKQGVSTFVYCPGGPPEKEYIRHSTFDINDGRQSFGILNTLSLIQEGKNGTDNWVENLKHRAESQMAGMRALLEFAYLHKDEIKQKVNAGRQLLKTATDVKQVAIQCEHTVNGQTLSIPLYSYYSHKDSTVVVKNYRPVVKSLLDIPKPIGYLIPTQNKELMKWIEWHGFITAKALPVSSKIVVAQLFISKIDSIDFEGDMIINPAIEAKTVTEKIVQGYVYVPVAQLKGNVLILALEPRSMLGLAIYPQFSGLIKVGENYPVLRVVKK